MCSAGTTAARDGIHYREACTNTITIAISVDEGEEDQDHPRLTQAN